MNDEKFVNANRTGIFKRLTKGTMTIPKEIRSEMEIDETSVVEIIPLHEGFYVRKAKGRKYKQV